MPVFLGYDQTERMIAALLDRAAQWQPEAVVGIARGGLVPATMAAGIMALPLAMIGFERASGATQWIGAPAGGGRVLLVDDGCSTGRTMEAVRAALLREGRDCLTLAVVHDPEVTRYVPDLSHPMRALWRFPVGARRGDAGRPRLARHRRGAGSGDRTAVLRAGPRRRVPARRAGCGVPCRHRRGGAATARAGAVPHPALLLARARRGDHRPARFGSRTHPGMAGALGPRRAAARVPPRRHVRTHRTRSRATRPRRRRAGAARISSKATPSRRCASRRTRRISW